MKIVIGYDGSILAQRILDDLPVAGLPSDTRALVVTIADPQADQIDYRTPFTPDDPVPIVATLPHAGKALTVAAARRIAERGAELLAASFPSWEIAADPFAADPAEGLISVAGQFAADLVVVGSHDRYGIGRLIAGSVSRRVVNEAGCSVRISRRRTSIPPSPLRLVLGFDGGPDAEAAVRAVAQRCWPSGTALLLVTALPPRGIVVGDDRSRRDSDPVTVERMENRANSAMDLLHQTGLSVELRMRRSAPDTMILECAEQWGADTIFVGARGHRLLERLLLGSVSVSVASRAECTVEIVRRS